MAILSNIKSLILGGYMDLFEYMRTTNQEKEAPLAARLRPVTLEEVEIGRAHV